jgi:hypothetical protein
VFVEIEPTTYGMDPRALEAALAQHRVKAILPVHAFGGMAALPELLELATRHGVPLIEDAACALGTTLHGQQGIRCNAITPGLIMHERLAEIFPAEQVRVDAENILTPSPGTPEDIGATVVFLASEQARFINAQVLPVDGGLLAHTPTYAQTRAMVSKRLEVKERS